MSLTPEQRKFREDFKRAVMSTGLNDDTAEVVMRRIADRLAGYSHDEVAQLHPLPKRSDSRSEAG